MTKAEKSRIQKEIVDGLSPKPHGRLLLAPRVGKTKLMIDIIKREKPESILWVTPSTELAEVDIPSQFNLWKAKKFLSRLTTVTWMSLNKIQGHFTLVILDEEQFATENNTKGLFTKYERFKGNNVSLEDMYAAAKKIKDYVELNKITYEHILSMTGTPSKHEEKKDLYKRLNLPVLCDLSINQAVDVGLLANYSIKVLEVELGHQNNIVAGTKDRPFMTSEINQYLYLTQAVDMAMYHKVKTFKIMARMRAIKNSPSKLKAAKNLIDNLEGRKLIFASTIAQSETLCKNTYNSKTDNVALTKFKNGEINEIALVNAGGTGHTYKKVDHLILVQADSDKNGLTTQKISRALLSQGAYRATIWIICLLRTQDEVWVTSTLDSFDSDKIVHIAYEDFEKTIDN